MAFGGRELKVYLTSDVSKFGRGLKQAETGMDKLRRAGRVAAVGITAGFAAAAVAMKSAITDASDLAESVNKASVIFGKSATDIEKWADSASLALGLNKQEALEVAGTFGSIAKQAGFGEVRTAKFAKRLAGMAADLASLNNTSVTDAAQALASGLRGEAEPLRRFNINTSDAAIQAEALASGIVSAEVESVKLKSAQLTLARAQDTYTAAVKKHGRTSNEAARAAAAMEIAEMRLSTVMEGKVPKLTETQKLQARVNRVFKDGADAVGDFNRTSDGIANSTKQIDALIDDLSAEVGTGLLDGLTGIEDGAGNVEQALFDAKDEAKDFGRTVGQGIMTGLTGIRTFVQGVQGLVAETVFTMEKLILGIERANLNIADFVGQISDEAGEAGRKDLDRRYANAEAAYKKILQDIYIGEPVPVKRVPRPPRPKDISRPVPLGGVSTFYDQYRPMSVDPTRYGQRAADSDARARARGVRTRDNP